LRGDETLDADFEKIKRGKLTVYIRRQFLNNSFGQAILSGEEKLREQYSFEAIPSSDFARVYRFSVSVDGVERKIYLKQFLNRRRLDFIKSIFQGSRAKRAFEAELILAKEHFDVPEAAAMVEHRTRFFHTRSFLITFAVEESKPFFQYLGKIRERLTQEQLKDWREIIRAFGRTVGRMHASNIFHGDLRLNNVLFRREAGNQRFFFLDNERTRQFKKLPFRYLVKNLVQINMAPAEVVSKSDRMRFFREYCVQTGISGEERKALISATLRMTGRRLRKRKRRHDN
jgi:hypothetical protein